MTAQTQKEQLLNLLRNRGRYGVWVYEIITPQPKGLGIAQYNARVYELRRAGYVIENVEPGLFKLISEPTNYKETGCGQLAFI